MPSSSAPRSSASGASLPRPLVSVRNVEDLACALPHLLGFRPVESLVLVAIDGPADQLSFTLRLDLPAPEEIEEVAEICALRMEAADADAVLVFVVTEAADVSAAELPGGELVEALQRVLPMPVRDAFLLRGERIWSYLCPDPDCCPAGGKPVVGDSAVASTLAAAGVVAGRPVYRDREEVVRAAEAAGGADAEATAAAVDRLYGEADRAEIRERYGRALPALLEACAERGGSLGHDDAALLGCAWHQVDLRDEMLGAIAREVPGADVLVRAVARLMPPPYDAPAATMLGWVAYAEGSGVLAGAALQRALATDPEYSLARLLDDGLYRQVPPSALRSVWAKFADNEDRRDPPRHGGARRRRRARGR